MEDSKQKCQRTSKVIAEVRLAGIAASKKSEIGEYRFNEQKQSDNKIPRKVVRDDSPTGKSTVVVSRNGPASKVSATWHGSCISNEKGRKYYGSFSKDGHRFKVNDCVELKSRSRDSKDIWLMKIINFWEDESFVPKNKSDLNMFFRGVWLYRQTDLPKGLNIAQHSQEIFLSDWEDENSLDCIQSKCRVLFRNARPESNDVLNGYDFVCWRSYAASTGRVAVCNFPDPLSLPASSNAAGSSLPRKALPINPSEIGIANWNGSCSVVENGRRYYNGFSKNGHTFEINDCVYVRSAEKDKIWLMRILKLWEEESWVPRDDDDINMFFRGVWLYRPSDTPQGMSIALHLREIFLSDWEDENSLECVQTKCQVFFRASPPDDKEEISGAHFVCWRRYAVSTGRISASRAEGEGGGDSLRDGGGAGLEGELALGRLVTMRVKARDGQEARGLLRQAGHLLVEAMVHMPVTHITRLLLAPATETLLLLHGREGAEEELVAAATYRKHEERQLMEIELLAVRGSAQRRGYGAVLMRGLVRLAAGEGLAALVTSADETAVGYFAACGFRASLRDQARAAPRPPPDDDDPRGRGRAGAGGGAGGAGPGRKRKAGGGEGGDGRGLTAYEHTVVMRRAVTAGDAAAPDMPLMTAWPL